MKTVFEEPQHSAADLGGVAEYWHAPVGAVGTVFLIGLAPALFSQRLLVLDPVLTHLAVKQYRHQDGDDNGQADLVVDGYHRPVVTAHCAQTSRSVCLLEAPAGSGWTIRAGWAETFTSGSVSVAPWKRMKFSSLKWLSW